MEKNQQNILHFLILVAGAVLAVQFVLLTGAVSSVRLSSLGIVSKSTIAMFLLAILVICAVLALYALLSIRSKSAKQNSKRIFLLPLSVGAILASLGLLIISLSSGIIWGVNPAFVSMIGVQLSALGILSLASFISDQGGSACLIRKVPNYAILVFFLLLIPAAFLL